MPCVWKFFFYAMNASWDHFNYTIRYASQGHCEKSDYSDLEICRAVLSCYTLLKNQSYPVLQTGNHLSHEKGINCRSATILRPSYLA
jgi:hypothetical protein